MRIVTLCAAVLLSACGPGTDPLIGSFTYQLTGQDTNTAPNNDGFAVSGTGTLVITANAEVTGYFVTLAHPDTNACTLAGTIDMKAMGPEITISSAQTCTFRTGNNSATATLTMGKAVLKVGQKRAEDLLTLDVAYGYAGVAGFAPFTVNFAGNGTRKYAGTRK